MNPYISNSGALEAQHYRDIEKREARNAALDHLQDKYAEELETDTSWLFELVFDSVSPEVIELRAELYSAMVQYLVPVAFDRLSGPIRQIAKPLQQIIAIEFAKRAERELKP